MSRTLKLIEYDSAIYAGDDMNPDIQIRDQIGSVSGQRPVSERELVQVDRDESLRRIEDMRQYARVLSSSSSSSESSSSEAAIEELFEHHETGGDDSYTIGQTGYSEKVVETFTPDIAHRISRVELELYDNQGDGLTGDITVEIKATDGSGLPTGAALASGTIDSADLNPGHYSDTYNGIYRPVTGGTHYLYEVCFSQDGLHMYSISYNTVWSNYGIHHYTLSTAWDITTASLIESHQLDDWGHGWWYFFANNYTGIYLKPDGTRIYIVGNYTGYGTYIWRIDLDTPFYISSATPYISQSLFATQQQYSCWFNDAGTRLFTADNANDAIFQYNLTTPWDITSLSSTPSQTTDISGYTTGVAGVALSANGLKMQVIDSANDKILFWNLSTAFELSGESKDSYELDMSAVTTSTVGCYTKGNGKTFFICDWAAMTIYRFDLPALHGDWHSCDLGAGYELAAATKYAAEATYADYEEGVSEPEWVNNADGDDNYAAGTMLRFDGSNWYDS